MTSELIQIDLVIHLVSLESAWTFYSFAYLRSSVSVPSPDASHVPFYPCSHAKVKAGREFLIVAARLVEKIRSLPPKGIASYNNCLALLPLYIIYAQLTHVAFLLKC